MGKNCSYAHIPRLSSKEPFGRLQSSISGFWLLKSSFSLSSFLTQTFLIYGESYGLQIGGEILWSRSLPLRLDSNGLKVPDFTSGDWCYLKGHYGGSAEDLRSIQMSGGRDLSLGDAEKFQPTFVVPFLSSQFNGILPENNFNDGWLGIAHHIESFINRGFVTKQQFWRTRIRRTDFHA